MLKFTRDYFSHSHRGLSCTKNALCLEVNNFHICYVIDMGISQFESLIISFQEKNHSMESSKTIEEIISVKSITFITLITLKRAIWYTQKKPRPYIILCIFSVLIIFYIYQTIYCFPNKFKSLLEKFRKYFQYDKKDKAVSFFFFDAYFDS